MNIAGSFPDIIAVVPAAGIGSRMQAECPKQYLSIGGKTLLEHALNSLLAHPAISRIIVAISPDDPFFPALPMASDPRITVVNGGKERADSVLAGLQAASASRWVLVHDAARPVCILMTSRGYWRSPRPVAWAAFLQPRYVTP